MCQLRDLILSVFLHQTQVVVFCFAGVLGSSAPWHNPSFPVNRRPVATSSAEEARRLAARLGPITLLRPWPEELHAATSLDTADFRFSPPAKELDASSTWLAVSTVPAFAGQKNRIAHLLDWTLSIFGPRSRQTDFMRQLLDWLVNLCAS